MKGRNPMSTSEPRVPLAATINLPGSQRTIQVNHCKMPDCSNFGVPARTEKGKPGPSADRDMNYKVHSTAKGTIPAVRCKACLDLPPIKSNASIRAEVERLAQATGIWTLEESTGCSNDGCGNHHRPIAFHPEEYRKRGKVKNGDGQYYECKRCRRRFLVSDPLRLHDNSRRYAVDILSRIANKSPVRGSVRGARLKSFDSYYPILDFIYRRCRAYSGRVDRALMDGRMKLPKDMNIQSDGQVYQLNWGSRLDRRNVDFTAYCSIHTWSRWVLGLHFNFDGRVDPFEINAKAAQRGDLARPEAFRKYAHYWLAGDELRAGRAMLRDDKKARASLLEQVDALYASASSRQDVEDIELAALDTAYTTPFLKYGLQVHMPYMAYAHWLLLQRILAGAGVEQVQVNTDIDSMSRGAFLSVFADEIKRGDAHAFFVNYTKWQTIDERERILAESRRKQAAFVATLPEAVREDTREVGRRMMRVRIEERQKRGKWDDQWVVHPFPTVDEPHKAVCWLTRHEAVDEDREADLHLRSGLSRIDSVFEKTRRLFSAFERPVGTSSTHNKVWHGYAPYNPAMMEKYLTIFRTVDNFVFKGDDGKTPAMRLGFTKEPLEYEDILWPGQSAPRPKAVRRRGKKAVAA